LVPYDPPDALLAIATDLLAQAEAQHRTATRLERSVRQLSRGASDRAIVMPSIEQAREYVRAMREVFEAERALLDEIERGLLGS
jgi:hypothetical protein